VLYAAYGWWGGPISGVISRNSLVGFRLSTALVCRGSAIIALDKKTEWLERTTGKRNL
jgi:hypothetical protein